MSFRDSNIIRPAWPFELNDQSPQAQGLAAWWPCVHPGGNRLFDLFSSKRMMALRGSVNWKASPFGGPSLYFDAVSGDTMVADGQASPTSCTWVIWCMLEAIGAQR